MENYDVVVAYFTTCDKPANAGQVALATGVDRKEVDKIMTKLKKDGTIVSPKNCYWEIKK